MPILPKNELDGYIKKIASEVEFITRDLLKRYLAGEAARGRVVENISRQVETALDTIEQSLGALPETAEDDYYSEP